MENGYGRIGRKLISLYFLLFGDKVARIWIVAGEKYGPKNVSKNSMLCSLVLYGKNAQAIRFTFPLRFKGLLLQLSKQDLKIYFFFFFRNS